MEGERHIVEHYLDEVAVVEAVKATGASEADVKHESLNMIGGPAILSAVVNSPRVQLPSPCPPLRARYETPSGRLINHWSSNRWW